MDVRLWGYQRLSQEDLCHMRSSQEQENQEARAGLGLL